MKPANRRMVNDPLPPAARAAEFAESNLPVALSSCRCDPGNSLNDAEIVRLFALARFLQR
jgi:hypothetical protein